MRTLFIVALLTAGLPVDASAKRLHGYGVENYEGTGQCFEGVNGNDLNHTIDQVAALDDVFDGWQALGFWDSSVQFYDAYVDPEDWTDVNRYTWGRDHVANGVDYADVGYFSGHGTAQYSCDNEQVPQSGIFMGKKHSGQPCVVESDQGGGGDEWLFGDDTLKIVMLDACQTMQHCVWEADSYDDVDGGSLRMIAGYHGNSYDTVGQVNALEDYAIASRTSGAGDNWLDFRFIGYPFPNLDQCPTVLIWGSSETNTDSFFNSGGLDDWINTGTHTMNAFYFLTNCDPNNGVEL